ncbi:MAG: nitroreductase [Prevotellaceae bacterium]|jgi:nitroreductase|nr:nitroreductase [Prevotellaceae bacterium]
MRNKIILSVLALTLVACQPPVKSTENTENQANVVVENILNRRSIRSYKPDQISSDVLDTLILCAINAPSAINRQPWEVRFVQNVELIRALEEGNAAYQKAQNPSREPSGEAFYGAPTIAIVAYEKEFGFGQLDCGWLGENILLAAESLNLGTCVIGSVRPFLTSEAGKDVLAQLQFSEGYEVLYGIAIGYKNQFPEAKPRDASKVQVIH